MLQDPSSWTPADIALAVLALAGLAAAALPVVVSCLGMTIVHYRPVEDPSEFKPAAPDAEFLEIFEDLAAAGFEPLGVIVEECWLFHHHWYKAFRVHALRNRDRTVYASVYRIVPGEPWRISLETFTDDGAMIRTVMPGAGLDVRMEGSSRREVGQCELIDLVEEHANHVADYTDDTRSAVIAVDLEDRAAIDERLDRAQIRQIGSTHNLYWLAIALFLPAVLAHAGLRSFGLSEPSRLAVALIAGCLIYGLFTWFVIPTLISKAAEEHNPA